VARGAGVEGRPGGRLSMKYMWYGVLALGVVFAATGCAKRAHAGGPATGDGIPVELNSGDVDQNGI
jgi:hypothetical protein